MSRDGFENKAQSVSGCEGALLAWVWIGCVSNWQSYKSNRVRTEGRVVYTLQSDQIKGD
jgi:hypothetical protein